jgi:hypothetical protein
MNNRCCNHILDFGCFDSCNVVYFDLLVADENGNYRFEINVLDEGFNITHFLTVGDRLYIDLTLFNENAYITFKVWHPNGYYIEVFSNDTLYDCFRIKSMPVATIE